MIEAAGLVPFVFNPSGGNFVIGQSPAALLGVLCGSTVRITAGTGCYVPFVKGSPVPDAIARISDAGLIARLTASGGLYVTHQSPAGGTQVGCQVKVDIRNESVTFVPDVRGRATASAIAEIQRQLLEPHSHPAASVVGGPSTDHVGKWVVGQSPAPGSAVAPFTHVHLYLSGRGEIP
jgi:beta-lactam-binding protein with PASTA domain